MATVKGDVHDIGKNIVSVVLSCNNYEMIDLGVMTPPELIIEKAISENVDIIGLSGLITQSLEEMIYVAKEMQRQGLKIPLLIGGAATSELHTSVKIEEHYDGPVIHVKDASQAVGIVSKLMSKTEKTDFVKYIERKYSEIKINYAKKLKQKNYYSLIEARSNKFNWKEKEARVQKPNELGVFEIS